MGARRPPPVTTRVGRPAPAGLPSEHRRELEVIAELAYELHAEVGALCRRLDALLAALAEPLGAAMGPRTAPIDETARLTFDVEDTATSSGDRRDAPPRGPSETRPAGVRTLGIIARILRAPPGQR